MAKNFNYRKYYKNYYGIDFLHEYDIHHIDEDRENNKINNLILLPKNLHKRYHMTLCRVHFEYEIFGKSLFTDLQHGFSNLEAYYNISKELKYWIDLKLDMDDFHDYEYLREYNMRVRYPDGIWEVAK